MALRSLGDAAPVLAVSSVPPGHGRSRRSPTRSTRTGRRLDLPAARARARRLGALADFVAEHGERGLRALGGRRAAERFLAEQDAGPRRRRARGGARGARGLDFLSFTTLA